jgi:hypothetical protein
MSHDKVVKFVPPRIYSMYGTCSSVDAVALNWASVLVAMLW